MGSTSASDLNGYDGYIFDSPINHRNMAEPMENFLSLARKADLEGKLAGAFGSSTKTSWWRAALPLESGDALAVIFHDMEYESGMEPLERGEFRLKEAVVETAEGMRACQDYGKVFGEELGN